MEMDLAPYTAFGAAVLARIPLAFTLHLDPRAVDQQVQWTLRPPMRDVHGKDLLATADRAEIRHIPVQSSQPKQALDEATSPWSLGPVALSWPDLPQRQIEQDLDRQADLHRRTRQHRRPPGP